MVTHGNAVVCASPQGDGASVGGVMLSECGLHQGACTSSPKVF